MTPITARSCLRRVCNARGAISSTGSCCDENYVNTIAKASRTHLAADKSNGAARTSSRAGLLYTLAQWRAKLKRAECL
ncbi:MAG: hypothetical protein FRX48_09565 [Lasallia pustulata]|uniref:Uncharacterized protein n=1 Tax=Lasallia pustulata TaxID=136370 RepID=A0A5M8PC39_9LECA|nr:MAG: hypothetical protein FRX48_09565 [Lasallia pustulata]